MWRMAALGVADGEPATLAGDARCDTPDHSAKYGSYTAATASSPWN